MKTACFVSAIVLSTLLATPRLGRSADETHAIVSWVRNGGFEQAGGWAVQGGTVTVGDRSGKCVRIEGPGGASQEILVAGQEHTMTAAVDLQTAGVAAESGGAGYAFAAVYQLDEDGRIVAFRDFAQATGTRPWERRHFTFRVDPRAATVSLRCGLFHAKGTACFDNWTLVLGDQPKRLVEVTELPLRPAKNGVAAILSQPDLPVRGNPSSPEVLARILRGVGIEAHLRSADELADPTRFSASHFDLLVVPTGPVFPAEARLTTIDFLQKGGNLITTGGYAFKDLVRRVGDRWMSEEEFVKLRLQEALEKKSLLPDGGFEKLGRFPRGGSTTDGQWHGGSDRCAVVEEDAKEGRFSAKVDLPLGMTDPGAHAWLDLPAQPGKTFRISGWMRTQGVTGTGIAFMAIYQHDAAGKLVEHRDFASTRGTTPWTFYTYVFTPKPQVARLHIFFGLYQAHGTAWFDDIRLVETTGLQLRPMNTSTGTPGDGLSVAPTQIGIFDASFPLKRACMLRTAPGQHVLREPIEFGVARLDRCRVPVSSDPITHSAAAVKQGHASGIVQPQWTGWAASGLVGYDNARWIPLLESSDRFGRARGPAGAMLLHYQGPFAGSCWAFFGAENVDLWADADGPGARGLRQIARFMLRKTFLHNLTTDHRLYREGEPVRATVVVDNGGPREFHGAVRFELLPEGSSRHPRPLSRPRERGEAEAAEPLAAVVREVTVKPGSSQSVAGELPKISQHADLGRLTATLVEEGTPIDEMVSGVVFEDAAVRKSGPQLRFRDNYFTLNDRPMFLFGSDTYSLIYKAACENPWTWWQEIAAARDMGMNLYENLQYQTPGHQMEDDDWRAFRAVAQLTQKAGQVFMPGMLIGQNVAIGDAALEEEDRLCREYASHLGSTPGLLWYINGDYQLDPRRRPEEVKSLWNRWLKAEYGTTQRLRASWGDAAVRGELGSLDYPPPNSGRWDDAAAVDRSRFLVGLMRRWNEAHVAAVRKHDPAHPITSEYYSSPFGGMDLILSIDGQDVSNIGFFDRPGDDLDQLPLKLRWNDLRLRGKGVSLGEYGVKTHPAWSEENGARGYHIARSEEEQNQLFLAVAHYGLGLGACKVQNWCLRDDPTWVFPWGIFYPNQLVPKDVACVHRNQSFVWRFFRPAHRPAALAVGIANCLRLGNDDALGTAVAYRTFADLLALHHDWAVIDDDHLERLPAGTKAMVLPCPLAMRDEGFERLLAWVRAGGSLLVTGDFTHDASRRRTRTSRLKELAGVEYVEALCPATSRNLAKEVQAELPGLGIERVALRPCLRVKPAGAEVLGKTSEGEPVLVRHTLGRGTVYFLTDPIELADDQPTADVRRRIYSALLRAAGLAPLEAKPNEPWLHVMAQATARGTVHVLYNTKPGPGTAAVTLPTAASPVTLTTRNRWPAMAAVTETGDVVAVNAYGHAAVGGKTFMAGTGLKALLSLDGKDLRESGAIVVAPFEPGALELPGRTSADGVCVALVGEFHNGTWTTLERIPLEPGATRVEIDADRATCLILICREAESVRWTGRLTQAMQRPDQIDGY